MRLNELEKELMIQYFKKQRFEKHPVLIRTLTDFYDTFDAFYDTEDCWCGSFKYNKNLYVGLKICFFKEGDMKLVFAGNDDFGLEKTYQDVNVAIQELKELDKRYFINCEDLYAEGFTAM